MLGSSTHTSLVYLMNKPLLFFSYKDTFHTWQGASLQIWSSCPDLAKLIHRFYINLFFDSFQHLAEVFIQTNLITSPVALSKSWWSWINLPWTFNQTSLRLWTSFTSLGTTTLQLRKLERRILHLVNSSTWLPPLRKDKLGNTKR